MPLTPSLFRQSSGFTLVELLVVITIVAVLFVLSTINLGTSQSTASVATVASTLLADLKNQQILAMSGDSGSTTSQQPHGVYLQASNYTLFADPTYASSDPNNYTVPVSPVQLQTTFPSNQVVFSKGNGEVSGFTGGSNTITISGAGLTKTITINRFGAISIH